MMSDTRTLPFRQRLARELSDAALMGGERLADPAGPLVDVSIHTHFVPTGTLSPPPDDPLHRRDDPMAAQHRAFMAGPHADLARVEPALFRWFQAEPGRAEQFAENPAAVIRQLPQVEPEVKARLTRYFGRHGAALKPQLPGVNVGEMTFSATPANPEPLAFAPFKGGEAIDADALFQVGFSHLARIFAEKMLPAVRDAAAQIEFVTSAVLGTVRLLSLHPVDQPAFVSADSLKLKVQFDNPQLETRTPLGTGITIIDLRTVTLEATLKLSTSPPAGGRQLVELNLAENGLTVTKDDTNAVEALVWDAAKARIVDMLAPYFTFQVPLTLPSGVCGIQPRKVAAALLPPGAEGSGTQPALALAVALLESTDLNALSPGAASRVKDGQDGALFLSNLLVTEIACCLLSTSAEFSMLPAPVHEATEAEPFCRWENVSNFRLGGQQWGKLVHFEIRAVDGGFNTELKLYKSGTGWDMTVLVGVEMRLGLFEGALTTRATPTVKISKNIETWVQVVAILGMVVGAALVIIGLVASLPTAWLSSVFVVAGAALFTISLALGVVVFAVKELVDAVLPANLATVDEFVGLLPGGITDKFGALAFLTDLDWDDLEFGGFLTLPGSPALVRGGDVVLPPGSGIDLDTGQVIAGIDLGARMDADLRLHEAPGMYAERLAAPGPADRPAPAGGGVLPYSTIAFSSRPGVDFGGIVAPRGRRLQAIGASRLVVFSGRPFPSIGYSDLAQLGFPLTATEMSVPGAPQPNANSTVATFAVRTSAGRLASCAIWTDRTQRTILRYRTYDTPIWLSFREEIFVQPTGKPGTTDISYALNGKFTAVPGPQWPAQPPTRYRWYWSGRELIGAGELDGEGTSFVVIGDRCEIATDSGVGLDGWLCAVASKPSGLETSVCRNLVQVGEVKEPPHGDWDSRPGTPGSGPSGPQHL